MHSRCMGGCHSRPDESEEVIPRDRIVDHVVARLSAGQQSASQQ